MAHRTINIEHTGAPLRFGGVGGGLKCTVHKGLQMKEAGFLW
uniref:Uncharacterized protein n=1 Tax=Anguilla anguilla TaxID=7936 RepID=A0A0E9U2H8_ANGAN